MSKLLVSVTLGIVSGLMMVAGCSVTEFVPSAPADASDPDASTGKTGRRDDAASGDSADVSAPKPTLVTVAEGETNVGSVAFDSEFVYWTVPGAGGAVKKARLDGTSKPSMVVAAPHARNVRVGPTDLYFSMFDDPYDLIVSKVSKAGGAVTPIGTKALGYDFQIDQTYAYLTVSSISTSASGGGLYRAPLAGGGGFQPVALDPSATTLAVAAATVFWAVAPVNFNPGGLHLVKKGDPAVYEYGPTLGIDTKDAPFSLAAGATGLYWADARGIKTAAPNATTIDVLAQDPDVVALVVDDTNLYWTNETSVMMVSQSGGAPKKFADAKKPGALAVNGEHVVWAESGTGKIFAKLK